MHPTDYTFRLYDKNQDFFTSIASKIMSHYQYFLANKIKIFSHQINFFRQSIYDLQFDDFLLPCNIPTTIVKPLTVKKQLVSSPLDEKDKSYYTALPKQSHSYNKLLFISAKIISYMVQTENKSAHKPPLVEHTPPTLNF